MSDINDPRRTPIESGPTTARAQYGYYAEQAMLPEPVECGTPCGACEALAHTNAKMRQDLEAAQTEIARLQMQVDAMCDAESLRQEREARKKAETEIARLHGRIGLFAAKWFAISDNLPTEETFAAMESEIVDTANKYVALRGKNESLEAEVARLTHDLTTDTP